MLSPAHWLRQTIPLRFRVPDFSLSLPFKLATYLVPVQRTMHRMGAWQTWRDHPEQSRLRNVLFQVHFSIGALLSAYVFVMSVSGSLLVYGRELYEMGFPVERVAELHDNWLAGSTGHTANGIGAILLTLLCVTGAGIWWPGVTHWRRSLTVASRTSVARINWDLHSAVGFWCFPFVLMWAVSGAYLVFQNELVAWGVLDPWGRLAFWLAQLHLGQFNEVVQAVWVPMGLTLAILAFTGMFICCRRIIFKKPSNPKHAPN